MFTNPVANDILERLSIFLLGTEQHSDYSRHPEDTQKTLPLICRQVQGEDSLEVHSVLLLLALYHLFTRPYLRAVIWTREGQKSLWRGSLAGIRSFLNPWRDSQHSSLCWG